MVVASIGSSNEIRFGGLTGRAGLSFAEGVAHRIAPANPVFVPTMHINGAGLEGMGAAIVSPSGATSLTLFMARDQSGLIGPSYFSRAYFIFSSDVASRDGLAGRLHTWKAFAAFTLPTFCMTAISGSNHTYVPVLMALVWEM